MSIGQWAASFATALLIAASLAVYTAYQGAFGIETEAIDPESWGDGERPEPVEGIHNFLLLGVDTESEGERPDVLIIVNIDADRDAVTMVNIPRDLIVDIPACEADDEHPGWTGGLQQINHAATYGGMDCLGNTVETATGIRLDHMVMVDFAGFENIVNTVDGVEMCIPEPIDDPKAHLVLEAGTQTLDGAEALGLARSRASTDNGSDLERIESQQRLIGALVRKVTSGEFLSSPTSVYSFVDSVTDSMVTDDRLTVDTMANLALSMSDVDLDQVNMVTVPVVDSETHQYKVDPMQPQAGDLFAAVANGEVLPEEEDGAPEADEEPSLAPGDVSLRVLNGTGVTGLAAEVGVLLEGRGFVVGGVGNPVERTPAVTTVYHAPDQREAAELLAAELAAATVEEVDGLGPELELVMGAQDWDGLAVGGRSPSAEASDGEDGGVLEELDSTSAESDTAVCE
ncbi:LCP family protein [Nocardiopsis sp. LOL_012]|uniref:LCP family protein n=1 Tax=Nocardiopsis sp. LOL_012 TaxID=3345409 RepID=UPI003A85C076